MPGAVSRPERDSVCYMSPSRIHRGKSYQLLDIHISSVAPVRTPMGLAITALTTMPRSVAYPPGSWPRRMGAELAAGYCGETTVEAFIKRVGKEYPRPRINEGRRKLWLRDDLDEAILPDEMRRDRDVAEDL